jgi:predicted secreted protein
MPAIAAKKLKINVGTSESGPWTQVQDLQEASMTNEADNQDISTFSAEYVKRLQGLKDGSYEMSGFYNMDESAGQKMIRDALINDTPLYVQFLPDGTTGFQQEVKVGSFEVSGSADSVLEVSIELEGTDPISGV